MNFRLLFSISISLCFFTSVNGQQIKVQADSVYKHKKAYLYQISDAITESKVLLDSGTVSADGGIAFKHTLRGVHQLQLNIDRVNCSFFAQGQNSYTIYFQALPPNQARTFNNTNEVLPRFYDLSNDDINQVLGRFNTAFDAFFEAQIANLLDKGFREKFQIFKDSCEKIFSGTKNDFFTQYRWFSYANLEANIGASRKSLAQEYLLSDEYLLQNPEYGRFIQKFYEDYIFRFDRFAKDRPLENALKGANLTLFMERLKGDDFLKNRPKQRELVAFICLFDQLNQEKLFKKEAEAMLSELAAHAASEPVKQLATHALKQYRWLKPGNPCYAFQLEQIDGEEITLKSLSGKISLLCFGAGWSKLSVKELRLVEEICAPYHEKLNLVFISLDDDMYGFLDLIRGAKISSSMAASWQSDPYMLEAMNIISIPQFVLLDEKGRYIKWHTSYPSEKLADELKALFP